MTPEAELKKDIKSYLDSIGAYWCMIKGGAHSKPGDPDIVACFKGRFVGVEAKTYEGTQSTIQKLRQRQIEAAGGTYILARSVDDIRAVMDKFFKVEDRWKDRSLRNLRMYRVIPGVSVRLMTDNSFK